MKKALDVARYFLRRLDREAGDTISPLKLQKLLYYAQAWSLVLREKPLFSEAIEAWVSGPVVREVWDEYKTYKYYDIPQPDTENIEFSEDEIEVLEEVWESYGELSARKLRDLTHSESPWLNARNGLEPAERSTNSISHEEMKAYYSQFVEV
ncbi:MAG: SocA family protein [Cyanobacteria bacterium SBLK]|nr:SocA family protein [Cyanobacteria bacterium SBLK]